MSLRVLLLLCAFTVALPAKCDIDVDLQTLDVNGHAVVDQLLHLAKFTDDPNPAVTRILFTGKSNETSIAISLH
jgi:hypothetical protein